MLGAIAWMIRNPDRGLLVPDDLDHREVLEVAGGYLGPCQSIRTEWTPLSSWPNVFERFGRPRPETKDMWQFETFIV